MLSREVSSEWEEEGELSCGEDLASWKLVIIPVVSYVEVYCYVGA